MLCEALSTLEAEPLRHKMIIPSHRPYAIGRIVNYENITQRGTLLHVRVPLALGTIPLEGYVIISRALMRFLVDVYADDLHELSRFEGGAFHTRFDTYLNRHAPALYGNVQFCTFHFVSSHANLMAIVAGWLPYRNLYSHRSSINGHESQRRCTCS